VGCAEVGAPGNAVSTTCVSGWVEVLDE